MKKSFLVSVMLASCVFSASVFAAEKVSLTNLVMGGGTGASQNCKMVESATVSLSFNNVPVTLETAKQSVDERMAQIETLAKDLGISNLVIQNVNYNVYGNNSGGCVSANGDTTSYVLNGSISLQMESADQAGEFVKSISGKGFIANLNVNSYRQCQ